MSDLPEVDAGDDRHLACGVGGPGMAPGSDPMPEKPTAELAEEVAAGRTGARCPFCGYEQARITTERDRRGVHSALWWCENCEESGACLADGSLYWNAEPDDR